HPGRGDVRRPDRRALEHGGHVSPLGAPVHRGAAQVGRAPGPSGAGAARLDPRCTAQPRSPPSGLLVRAALSAREGARALPRAGPGADPRRTGRAARRVGMPLRARAVRGGSRGAGGSAVSTAAAPPSAETLHGLRGGPAEALLWVAGLERTFAIGDGGVLG